MQTHRQIAKRKTTLWQIGAAGTLVLVVAVAGLSSIGDFFAPPRKPIEVKAPPVVVQVQSDSDLPIAAAGRSLATVTNFVAKPPTAASEDGAAAGPDGTPSGAAPAAATPPSSATDWAYIGSVTAGENRRAFVRINGEQQILGVGAKYNDEEVVTIEPDYIEIETSGATHKIERTARKLLAPTEGPKHPVAFRQPPTFAATPNGVTPQMAMNQPQGASMRANPASTLNQQQSAAMAAAEAARRNQAALEASMLPVEKIDPSQRDAAAKALSDPGLADEDRMRHLANLGIVPGTPIEAAVLRLKETGIDLGGDNYKRIINSLESNAKGGK